MNYWRGIAPTEYDAWADRTFVVSAALALVARSKPVVIDLGCSHGWLWRSIASADRLITYYGVDLPDPAEPLDFPRDESTMLVHHDLNEGGLLPLEVERGFKHPSSDVVAVASGVLEYLNDVERCVRDAAILADTFILTYAPGSGPKTCPEDAVLGRVNWLSEAEVMELLWSRWRSVEVFQRGTDDDPRTLFIRCTHPYLAGKADLS